MERILVIDDDPSIRKLISKVLEDEGYEVQTAASGKEGLQAYRSHPFGLVITDLIMPDQDGIETILQLRGVDPALRIVAISGGGQLGLEVSLPNALALGAQEVLEKPFSPEELLAAVTPLASFSGFEVSV